MKLKNIIGLSLVAIFTLSVIVVKAQENISTSTEGMKERIEKPFEKRDIRNPLIQQRSAIRDEIRDIRQEQKGLRASTTDAMKQIHNERKDEIKNIRASSTMMFKELKGKKREEMKNLKLHDFTIRKNILSRELNQAIKNLENIDSRLNNRISNATSTGRDLTEAKAALIIAESKLAAAKIAVNAFISFNHASSTVSTGTTTEVNLEKPRKLGGDAIKAVKDARDSFKIVVRLIAKNMGLGEMKRNDENRPETSTSTTN